MFIDTHLQYYFKFNLPKYWKCNDDGLKASGKGFEQCVAGTEEYKWNGWVEC